MSTPRKRWPDTALTCRDGCAAQLIAAYRELRAARTAQHIPADVQVHMGNVESAILLAAMHMNVAGAGIQLDQRL